MAVSLSESITAGPRLKVKRAHRHIDELRRMTDPLDRSLYEITLTKKRRFAIELHPSMHELAYRPKEKIPETLALIIGDAVHNLRAALDHLASGILRALHPSPPDRPFFPMSTERKNLKTDPNLTAIEEALPGSKKLLLEKVRPANGGDEPFWRFNALDNDDKHTLIIPTVTVVMIRNINIRTSQCTVEDATVGNDAARPCTIMLSGVPIAIDNNFKTAVEVKFGDGTAFENQPVVPTLTQISDLVSKTIKEFGVHIATHEASVGLQGGTIGGRAG